MSLANAGMSERFPWERPLAVVSGELNPFAKYVSRPTTKEPRSELDRGNFISMLIEVIFVGTASG